MKECEGRDTRIENGSLFSPGVPSVESVRIIAEYFYSGGLSHLSSRGGEVLAGLLTTGGGVGYSN